MKKKSKNFIHIFISSVEKGDDLRFTFDKNSLNEISISCFDFLVSRVY